MAKIDELFKLMVDRGASDLHMAAGSAPFLRLHGEMDKIEMEELSNEACQALIFEILSDKQKKLFIENWELDCSYTVPGLARFRVNVFMQRKGMGAVFRVIPERIKTAEELNLPKELLDMIRIPKGLICVTGPTGSGKSTTLAALIDHINRNENAHILTIEDPIEFVHPNHKSLVNQREVGGHTKTFASALKASLREDPDVILVGEMRDLETIQLALTAAETGHLVFGTLHTSSAAKTVDRIIDVFPVNQQAQVRVMLAESLRGVIAQTLLPKEGGGRVAAIEIMTSTKAIANLIREGKTFQIPSTMQISRNQGNMPFDHALQDLVVKGMISKATMFDALGKIAGDHSTPAPAPATPPPSAMAAAAAAAAAPPVAPTPPPPTGLSGLAARLKKSS